MPSATSATRRRIPVAQRPAPERKKDAVAIEAPAVDAPRKKIKRPAFLEKKPRRKAEPKKPEAP